MRGTQQQLGNLGTISAFACRHKETKNTLCRGGRSQDLPDIDFYVLFVLRRSVYCLCVNVYCTTATGDNPIAVNKYIIYPIIITKHGQLLFSLLYRFSQGNQTKKPIPVVAPSKAWFSDRTLVSIADSNAAVGMEILSVCCTDRGLCDGTITHPEKSFRVWR